MKTIVLSICIFYFGAFTVNAQTPPPDKYCAKLLDGKLVVMHEENILAGTAFLNDGTEVHPDGTVVKKEGTKSALKEGECIENTSRPVEKKPEEQPKEKGKM